MFLDVAGRADRRSTSSANGISLIIRPLPIVARIPGLHLSPCSLKGGHLKKCRFSPWGEGRATDVTFSRSLLVLIFPLLSWVVGGLLHHPGATTHPRPSSANTSAPRVSFGGTRAFSPAAAGYSTIPRRQGPVNRSPASPADCCRIFVLQNLLAQPHGCGWADGLATSTSCCQILPCTTSPTSPLIYFFCYFWTRPHLQPQGHGPQSARTTVLSFPAIGRAKRTARNISRRVECMAPSTPFRRRGVPAVLSRLDSESHHSAMPQGGLSGRCRFSTAPPLGLLIVISVALRRSAPKITVTWLNAKLPRP